MHQIFLFTGQQSRLSNHVSQGRNTQSTFDTCNALKTNTRRPQRAERPGASRFRLSRPAPWFAPPDPEKFARPKNARLSTFSRWVCYRSEGGSFRLTRSRRERNLETMSRRPATNPPSSVVHSLAGVCSSRRRVEHRQLMSRALALLLRAQVPSTQDPRRAPRFRTVTRDSQSSRIAPNSLKRNDRVPVYPRRPGAPKVRIVQPKKFCK